jgi:toxin YoeB
MGKYKIILKPAAVKDLLKHKKAGDIATNKKIVTILKELEIHPFTGIGNPEELKYNFKGLWSRRLNKKDRIIYEVHENIVTIDVISAIGHYSDK